MLGNIGGSVGYLQMLQLCPIPESFFRGPFQQILTDIHGAHTLAQPEEKESTISSKQ